MLPDKLWGDLELWYQGGDLNLGVGGAKILGGGMNHNDAMVCMYIKQMYVQLFQLYQGHS